MFHQLFTGWSKTALRNIFISFSIRVLNVIDVCLWSGDRQSWWPSSGAHVETDGRRGVYVWFLFTRSLHFSCNCYFVVLCGSPGGSGEQIAGWTGVLHLVWDAVMAQLFAYPLLITLLHSKSCFPLFVYLFVIWRLCWKPNFWRILFKWLILRYLMLFKW